MKTRSTTPACLLAAGMLAAGGTAAIAEPITLTVDPVHPTTADRVTVRAHFDPAFCSPMTSNVWQPPHIEGRTIHLVQSEAILDPPSCVTPLDYEVVLPALVEGSWSVDLQAPGSAAARAFDVTAPTKTLYLAGGRFAATVSWHGRDGGTHAADAVSLGDSSGAFWFFDSGNVELTLKLLDGGILNGKLWVFIASATDVAYTVTVVDRSFFCVAAPCPNTRVYEGVAGKNRNVLDTAAFDAPAAGEAR